MKNVIFTLTLNPALDRFLYANRLVQDDTVRIRQVRDYPAGKGIDVSRAINELDGHSVAISFLGGHNGREIEEMLDEEGVVYATVRSEFETRMNILVETDEGQYRMSLPGPRISEREIEKLCKTVDVLLREGDTLLLCGSVPEGVDPSIYRKICSNMKEKSVSVYLDSDKEPFAEGVKASPKGIKPNTHELQRLLGREVEDRTEEAVREVASKYSVEEILLTMGARGAMALVNGELYTVRVPKVPVKSAVGAGDSFLGAYCMHRESGASVEESLRMAGAASSAAVMTPGTELCRKEDVLELLSKVEVTLR